MLWNDIHVIAGNGNQNTVKEMMGFKKEIAGEMKCSRMLQKHVF